YARKAALIGLRCFCIVAGVDGGTAAQKRMRKSRAAVVLQRSKPQYCGRDVQQVAWPWNDRAIRRTDKVVAGLNVTRRTAGKVNCCALISSENGVRDNNDTRGIIQSASHSNRALKRAGSGIDGDGAVSQHRITGRPA